MIQTYYLEKYPIQSNAYTVSRSETWTFRKDQQFENEEEAREYVMSKNRYTPEFVLQAEGFVEHRRDELLERFSFNDHYLLKRRYFIDPLPIEKLKALISDNYLIKE
jgi:hypothetical protein